MPDLTPYVPLFTAIVTALAALGGVWITTWTTRTSAERQLIADQKREDARLAREDADRTASDQREKVERSAATYRSVAALFLNEFSTVRSWDSAVPVGDDSGFEEWYGRQWSAQGEARLLRAVADVRKNDRRAQLNRVVEAISLFPNIASYTYASRSWLVERTCKVGFDLASSWARGQDADEDLLERFKDVSSDVELVHEMWETDREARKEAAAKPKRKSSTKSSTIETKD